MRCDSDLCEPRMRSSILATVLSIGWIAADAMAAPVSGPELGTWSMKITETGKPHTSTMVLVRRSGSRVEGYIDWRGLVPGRCLEIIAGTLDADSRKLHIVSREMRTNTDGANLGVFAGDLSTDGREVRFSPMAVATWTGASIPSPLPPAAQSLEETDDRLRLYMQLSTEYKLQHDRVLIGPDRGLLEELARSKDAHVQAIAKLYLGLSDMHDDAEGKARRHRVEYVKGLPAEVYKGLFGTVAAARAGRLPIAPIVDLLNSSLLQKRFKQETQRMAYHIVQAEGINELRQAIRADYPRRGVSLRLAAGEFSCLYKLDPAGRLVLVICNLTKRTLHNSCISSRLVIDQRAVDGMERSYADKNTDSIVLFSLAGVNMLPAVEADMAVLAYHRIDKSMVAFVREWNPGVGVEFAIARASAVHDLGSSADAWVGCDEGSVDLQLDLTAMERAAKPIPAMPVAPKSPARTKPAPKRATKQKPR